MLADLSRCMLSLFCRKSIQKQHKLTTFWSTHCANTSHCNMKERTRARVVILRGHSVTLIPVFSPWALFYWKPNTEPKPNRIVISSVFWFGFGFQFCEVRCSASASVSMPYRTEVPRNRIVGSPAGWNLFFFLLFIKTDGVLWFIIKNELQICNIWFEHWIVKFVTVLSLQIIYCAVQVCTVLCCQF